MSKDKPSNVTTRSSSGDIAAFVKRAGELGALKTKKERKGRLIFSLDATMSRQATWDMACHLQSELFQVVDQVGSLEVQLNYYRGFGECRASAWVDTSDALARFMRKIRCQGGRTQIAKVIANARKQHEETPVSALVFIGDAMEEDIDLICEKAGALGMLGVPMFIFQEGRDRAVERAFREFARLSRGAYARFDEAAASQLAELLRAVAIYATGGLTALEAKGDQLLLPQMKNGR